MVESEPVYIQEEDDGPGILPFLLGGAALALGAAVLANNH
jgi:hypothetical protein